MSLGFRLYGAQSTPRVSSLTPRNPPSLLLTPWKSKFTRGEGVEGLTLTFLGQSDVDLLKLDDISLPERTVEATAIILVVIKQQRRPRESVVHQQIENKIFPENYIQKWASERAKSLERKKKKIQLFPSQCQDQERQVCGCRRRSRRSDNRPSARPANQLAERPHCLSLVAYNAIVYRLGRGFPDVFSRSSLPRPRVLNFVLLTDHLFSSGRVSYHK